MEKSININVHVAEYRGFCAGVDRAIEMVEKSLLKYGTPVYVRHEIVHNKYVVEGLKKKVLYLLSHLQTSLKILKRLSFFQLMESVKRYYYLQKI